jgi:hypothetical protein
MVILVPMELQELVDAPNERLDAEYKSWIDLFGDHEARANLARHIAAIANHGGGYIVFGFDNQMAYAGPNPFPGNLIDRDLVSSIVKKYLEPSFQCNVHIVAAANGNDHPIIVVPAHGTYPICAEADGPIVAGKPRALRAGTYYARKAGPESAPVTTPAEWAPIIRRCALHERSTILGAIDLTIRGATAPLLQGPGGSAEADQLKIWHDAAHTAFLRETDNYFDPVQAEGRQEVNKGHFQFSCEIGLVDGAKLEYAGLLQTLLEVHNEAGDISRGSSWLFYPYTRPGIAPRFVVDPTAGLGDEDFLECSLLRDPERPVESDFLASLCGWQVDHCRFVLRG